MCATVCLWECKICESEIIAKIYTGNASRRAAGANGKIKVYIFYVKFVRCMMQADQLPGGQVGF